MRIVSGLKSTVVAFMFAAAVLVMSIAMLGVAFGRASPESLLAANVVGRLLSYRTMQATEQVGGMIEHAACTEALVRDRRGRLVPASLAVVGGRPLYDAGHGVRRAPSRKLANGIDRVRFLLAGCPVFLGQRLSARLSRDGEIEAALAHADGLATVSLRFGSRRTPIELEVARRTSLPIALFFLGRRLRGWSDLVPVTARGSSVALLKQFSRFQPRVRNA